MQRTFVILSLLLVPLSVTHLAGWAGTNSSLSRDKVGLPYPEKEKMTLEMLTWISDELLYDYITAVDIDPAAFDFEPEKVRSDEKNADSVTIDFLSRILFPHEQRDVALSDIVGNELSHEKVRREMYFVPAKAVSAHGSSNETTHPINATVRQDGIQIIGNFPKDNSISPFETGQFNSVERSFYIDRRPVSNRDYREFIRSTGRKGPSHWDKLNISNDIKDDPVTNVSYDDAAAYAAWVGKRLPRASEYERAFNKNASLRVNAPIAEWTSTPTQGTKLESHYRYGGEAAPNNFTDSHTGFRTAIDGK